MDRPLLPPYASPDRRPVPPQPASPTPGQQALVLALVLIGIMLMGVQLWLLTVALELYLAGHGDEVVGLALISGLIFLGGLLVLRVLGRRPRIGG